MVFDVSQFKWLSNYIYIFFNYIKKKCVPRWLGAVLAGTLKHFSITIIYNKINCNVYFWFCILCINHVYFVSIVYFFFIPILMRQNNVMIYIWRIYSFSIEKLYLLIIDCRYGTMTRATILCLKVARVTRGGVGKVMRSWPSLARIFGSLNKYISIFIFDVPYFLRQP